MKSSRVVAALAAVLTLAVAAPAAAQTWVGPRTTPGLGELFAIDKTGEPNWPYGQEDVAGDGLATFKQQEQSIDIRTAYAATDANRLWLRVYVSDSASPGGNVTAYFFIDSDNNSNTGGSAAATSIEAKFTSDSSPGGYEYVLGVRGNGSVTGLWRWQTPQNQWTTVQLNPNQSAAESGTDLDPIRLDGDTHGYLQGAINLTAVNLTSACDAQLYVRSVNDVAALGAGDLEVGQVGSCVPATGSNGVPGVLQPPGGCTSNNQCPAGGVCVSGKCVIAQPCVSNADCPANQQCTADGRCVPKPSGNCTTNADCSNGLVCSGGQCVACTSSSQCNTGLTCAPTGRCVTSSGGTGGSGAGGAAGSGNPATLPSGEAVKGGACACSVPGGRQGGPLALALALLLPLGFSARRRHRSP